MYDQQVNTACRQVAERIDDLFDALAMLGRPTWHSDYFAIEADIFNTITVWADVWEDKGDCEVAAGLVAIVRRRNLPRWAAPAAYWRLLPTEPAWVDIRHSLWPEEFAALCDADHDPIADSVVTYDCPTDALVALARVLSRRLAAIAEGVKNGQSS